MNNYGESCIMTWPLGPVKCWDIFCENWEPRRRTALKRGVCDSKLVGSLSKRTFQGDAVVKSAKARDSRRRSRTKFNLLSTGATRLGGLHSQILACLIRLSLLWYVNEFCQILLLLLQCQSYF